jgi:hypothetical protein
MSRINTDNTCRVIKGEQETHRRVVAHLLKMKRLMAYNKVKSAQLRSKEYAETIYRQNTACQVWTHLAKKFASNSHSRISHLKAQASTPYVKIRDPKIAQITCFVAKSWADQLAAVGKTVDDEDLISYVVGGLNPSYHSFITSLSFATREASI